MLSKSLLSLAVAASLVGMSGCQISSVEDNDTVVPESQLIKAANSANKVTHAFDAFNKGFALGSDLVFNGSTDGTANVGGDGTNPVLEALNDLDGGISTLAPMYLNLTGSIDPNSIKTTNVMLVRLPNQADVTTLALTLPLIELDENGAFVGAYNAAVALDTGHTQRQMTAFDVDALSLATIGALFSPLTPSGTAPTSAAETVGGQNLGKVFASQPVQGTDYEVDVITLDGVANNAIRIAPLKPLSAKTKYITVLTSDVTTADGVAVQEAASYEQISGTGALFNPAFAPLRTLYQTLESLAGSIVTAGGTIPAKLTGAIVSTTARTTIDPSAVLKSMASPTYWLPTVVTNNTIADAIIEAGLGEGASAGVVDAAKIPTAIAVANGALTAANPALGGATAYEHPRARAFELIKNVGGAGVNQLPVSAASGGLLTENVLVSQGAIELPQYTVAFASDFGDYWNGNTTIGAVLDGALGQTAGTTPPSDADGTKNVTYRYPFAMEQRKIVAPILMFEPTATSTAACTKPAAGWPVVIMQHGFTSVRTANLINATKLADNSCHAVVAMDLPHHGVAAESTQLGLGVDFSNGAATPFATAKETYVASVAAADTILDTLAERHEGFYGVGGVPTVMNYGDTKAGDSGSLWIRLDNFQRGRDNMRQATMDLLNLNASLGAIDLNGDGTADLDVANVNYIGHSLGGIVGTTFVAVNNDATVQAGNANLPKIQKAILATPGGNLAKMIESSVGIGPKIIGGLDAKGIAQGSSSFESFIVVMQATLDSADPMNFIGDLAVGGSSTTPTLITEMVGNGTATNLADLVVPNNGVGSVLASGAARPESAQSPFVGTDPMIALLGATNVLTSTTEQHLVAKYHTGGHGTFSSAGTSTSATSFDSAIAYGEMLSQSIQFLSSGTVVTTDASNVLVAD